jgi:hypothetical protein
MTQNECLEATGEAFGVIEPNGEYTWFSKWMDAETYRQKSRSRVGSFDVSDKPTRKPITPQVEAILGMTPLGIAASKAAFAPTSFEDKPNLQAAQQTLLGMAEMAGFKSAKVSKVSDGVQCLEFGF